MLRTACATAVAVWLVLVALGCGLVHFASVASGAARTSTVSAQPGRDGAVSGVAAVQVSVDRAIAPKCSKLLATTPLLGPVTSVAGFGVVVALCLSAGAWTPLVRPAGRGPPVASGTVLAGRDLLTRLCIARR